MRNRFQKCSTRPYCSAECSLAQQLCAKRANCNKSIKPPSIPSGNIHKIYIGGIPSSANEELLGKHFSQFGPICALLLPRDKSHSTQTSSGTAIPHRGFAYVTYIYRDSAKKALLHQHFVLGKMVDSSGSSRSRPVQESNESQKYRARPSRLTCASVEPLKKYSSLSSNNL